MKKRYYFLTLITLLIVSAFTNAPDKRKKISNKLYSFSVPADWIPSYPEKGDGLSPSERDAYIYHLYELSWMSSVTDEKGMNKVWLRIESYERLDKQPLTINDIEKQELSRAKYSAGKDSLNLVWDDVSTKANQKRIFTKGTRMKIDAQTGTSYEKYCKTYLLQKSGNIVHLVTISADEDYYLLPETQKNINDILNSFSVKKGKP